MIQRRTLAKAIRARQEIQKRLDALWHPASPRRLVSDGPRIWTPPVGRPGLPRGSSAAILAEAEEVRSGRWRVFGRTLSLESSGAMWRTHPDSDVETPLVHWSRVRYLHGETGGDVKEIWEINRHRGLVRLAQAWFLDQDPRWLSSLAGYLDAWIIQNPPGMGINWASSLEVAFRAISWTWLRALTNDAPIWTPTRDQAFALSLWHHGRHVERFDSVHHSPNTHLLGEGLALALLGRAWPRWPRARDWVELGDAILFEEIEHQVLQDGMHVERSPGYHRYSVEFYLLFMILRRRFAEPIRPQVRSVLARMMEVLVTLRGPDGRLPGLGDEDGGYSLPLGVGHPRDPSRVLVVGGALFGRGDWVANTVQEARDFAWWILDDSEWEALGRIEERSESWRVRSLDVAGYYVMREPRPGGWWCLVSGGPPTGRLSGHEHADLGHVELQWNFRACLSDPGSIQYSPDAASRAYDRSPEAHATLVIEGASWAESVGPFRWVRHPPASSTLVSCHEDWSLVCLRYRWGSEEGRDLIHERQVALLEGGGIVIVDRVSGAGGMALTLSWPIPGPASGIKLTEKAAMLTLSPIRIEWRGEGVVEWTESLEQRVFANTYRTPVPGAVLRLKGQAMDDVLVVSWFTAASETLTVEVDGGLIRVERPGRNAVELSAGLS